MPWREGQALRVAVVARSVYPLHRYGGLERHVYDLVGRSCPAAFTSPHHAPAAPIDQRTPAYAVFRPPNLTLETLP